MDLLTLESLSLGDSNDVNHLVLGKDLLAADLLLKVVPGKIDLVSNRSSIQLDLNNVGLLLAPAQDLLLGVADDTDHTAVLLDLVEVLLNLLLAKVIRPLLGRLGEGLLLGLRPKS